MYIGLEMSFYLRRHIFFVSRLKKKKKIVHSGILIPQTVYMI